MRAVLATIGVTLAGAAFGADDIKAKLPAEKMLSADGGRFVFGQVSEYRRDQYMIDTKTGRLWKIVYAKYKNDKGEDVPGDGYPILEQIPYEDTKGVRTSEPGK